MASVAVTNTFSNASTITASGHNTNFSDLVNYINNRNDGTSTWDALRVTTSSAVVAILNNSTGTANILNAQDNGTNVFSVADGGGTTIRATDGGSSIPLTVNNGTSTGNIVEFQDNGTAVFSIADGGTLTHEKAVVFNEGGAATSDVRMEGDTNSNLFLLDASADAIGIGHASPAAALHIAGLSGTQGAIIIDNGTSTGTIVTVADNGTTVFSIADGGTLTQEKSFVFNEGGAATSDFRMEGDTNANLFFLDASADQIFFGGTAAGAGTLTYTSGGGIQMGAPTGGDKGSGTANFAGDIYKNNTAYTNPDYVFERFFTGKIERFIKNPGASDYQGLLPLNSLQSYIESNHDLPGVKERFRDVDGGQGIFARADIALEKIEEAHLYILELHKRLLHLEAKG